MSRARTAALLSVVLLVLGGCPFFNVPLPDSLSDILDNIGRPAPGTVGTRVAVRVDNRSAHAVDVTVRMTIGDDLVNFAEVRMPVGGQPLLVGPDQAVEVTVFATNVDDGEVRLDETFRQRDDFSSGDIILLVIEDDEPPVRPAPPVVSCPADITVACGDELDVALTGVPAAEGDCPGELIASFVDTDDGGDCTRIINRTWRIADECGNIVTCEQIVTVVDDEAPQLVCPPGLTTTCGASLDPEATGRATATDCHDFEITFSDSGDACGAIVRTWRAEDACGNVSTCDQTIIVGRPRPTITCPADVTLSCEAPTDPDHTGFATGASECGEVTVTWDDQVEGECPRTITRTWTATDDCGTRVSCTQIIRAVDPPLVTCPGETFVECGDATDPNSTGRPEAFDRCGAGLTLSFSDEVEDRDPGQGDEPNQVVQVITRTWTVSDGCEHQVTCEQRIRIEDTTPPQLTCPPDLDQSCAEPASPAYTGFPEFGDCDPNVFVDYYDFVTPDPNNPDGCSECDPNDCFVTIWRTWYAYDRAGNYADCVQKIRRVDLVAPLIDCPPDAFLECGDPTDPVVAPQLPCDGQPDAILLPGPFDPHRKNISFVATGVLGDGWFPGPDPNQVDPNGLREFSLGATGNGPYGEGQQTDYFWSPGRALPFRLSYDPNDGEAVLTVDGEVSVRYSLGGPQALTDIYIRAFSPATIPGEATAKVSSLLLDGFQFGDTVEAGTLNGDLNENVLRIGCVDLSGGFTLTGHATLTFDPNDPAFAGRSLGFQILVGVFDEPLGTGLPDVFDAIDPRVQVEYFDNVIGECELIERTWRATDSSGNASECLQLLSYFAQP